MMVYDGLRAFLNHVTTSPEVYPEALRDFAAVRSTATFLFGRDVTGYLDTVHHRAVLLRATTILLKGPHPDRRRVDEHEQLLNWFAAQVGEAASLFKPYLSVADIKVSQ